MPDGTFSRRSLLAAMAVAAFPLSIGQASSQAGASRRRLFVSPTGNDANAGTEDQPFRTIAAVFRQVGDLGAGDAIVVMPGTYEEAVVVTAGGDATGDLTLVSQVAHGALIRSPSESYSAVNIVRSFVTVEGFDVQSGGTGHGIEATFLDGDSHNDGPHHITVRNNICHDSAGSGISLSYGDNYVIENNVCFGNCATNTYQGSGVSVYAARPAGGGEGPGIVVRGNVSHDNTALTLPGDVPHSDGNGIIIDDLRNSQSGNPAGVYARQTLVENNVCYRNGGKGIHVYLSDHVSVCNNTCCYNNRDPKNPASWRGELSNVDSNDCLWLNNIGVADTLVNTANAAILDASSSGQPNRNVVWRRNLTFNGKRGVASITQSPANPSLTAKDPFNNMLGEDPKFVRAGPEEAEPDFHLAPKSPAIDAGEAVGEEGQPVANGSAPDLGAHESGGA